jgi:hypothetical protein
MPFREIAKRKHSLNAEAFPPQTQTHKKTVCGTT